MTKTNIVVDTNVFVSGLLKASKPRAVLVKITAPPFALLLSQDLLNELIFTLSKTRLSPYIPANDKAALIALLREKARLVAPKNKISVCRDESDNKILECAVAGESDIIVTGDKDLIDLNPFRKIQIFTPSEFLESKFCQ